MSKRNRVPDQNDASADKYEPSTPRATRPRGRWVWVIGTVAFALLVLVALAPTVVSKTSLGAKLIADAAQGKLDGSLEVQSVSVGWFSPTSVGGITIKDKDGQTIGTVEAVVVGRTLIDLIRSQRELGEINVNRPQLTVVARENGSNLEDLVAPLLNQPSSGGEMPTFSLLVNDGKVKLIDAATDQTWNLALQARVDSPRGTEKAWKIDAAAKTSEAAMTAQLTQILGEEASTQATLEADRFPLDPLQPILGRLLGPTLLSGTLTGKVEADLAKGGQQLRAALTGVEAADLAFASDKLLGQDVLRLSQVKASGIAQLSGGVWQLRDLEVQSEVAAVVGSGDVRVGDFTSGQAVPQTDCDIQGVVDLARLMQLLPNTLRAREGVQLTSGQARVSLVSQAVDGGRRFAATLWTEQVEAISGGRTIALEEPVKVTAAVVQSSRGWQIEKVDVRSSFLTAAAAGTLAKGNLTLQGDLNKLATELDQFVDLGDIRLAGQLGGSAQWQQEAGSTLAASGQFNFRSFELAMPGVMPWHEDDLVVSLQGRGIDPAQYGIGAGKVSVLSDTDELNLVLDQGANADASKPLPVDVRLTGNLATWLPRLQAFVPLAGWQVSGPVTIVAQGTASAARIDIEEAQFDLKQLQIHGHGLHVAEPQLTGQLKCSYDVTRGAATISNAVVRGQSLAASADNLLVQTGKEAKISGDVALRGDLGRVMSWLGDPSVPATSQFAGTAEAEATFNVIGGVTKANLKGQITDLAYLTRTPPPVATSGGVPARGVVAGAQWQTAWSEPLVTFGGDAAYDLTKDAVALDKMQAAMGTSAVVASGTVSQLASKCQLDLTGEVKYDLATWTPKIQPLLGPTFDMTGSGAKPFELHGPLWEKVSQGPSAEAPLLPLALTGKAGLGWEGAQWMALEVGLAELAAELKDSTIFVQPTKIPLSQGTLAMSPALSLRGSNWLVTQAQARVIDHIVITPQMCDTWIKFVFPPLAGATESQGKFSVDVDNAAVPLQQPTGLDAKGKFIVHNVSVGPGPLARSLIGAVSQVKDFANGKMGIEGLAGLAGSYLAPGATPAVPESTGTQWVELPEQEVPVTVVQGRVYHEGLTLKTKEFTLRSTGSVGIADQTIHLLCEVPLRDEWLKDPKLAGLKGQVLKIPVKGTISEPKPDVSAAFGGLVGLGTAGIKGALGSQIDKGLQGGTGAVQGEIGKVQNKVQGELDKGKKKVEDELRKGLKGLFK